MARLRTDGAENTGNTKTTFGVNTFSGSIAITTSPHPVHSGVYAYQAKLTGAVGMSHEHQFAAAAGNGPFYFRTYLYVQVLPNAQTEILLLKNATTTSVIRLHLNTTGTLTLADGTGNIGNSDALRTCEWYRVEIMFDHNGGAGAGIVELRIGGVRSVYSATRSFAAGLAKMTIGMDLITTTASSGCVLFDDLAINDTTGSYQNSWCNEGCCVMAIPDVAGDAAQWTPLASTNVSNVDELLPDGATSYNSSNTLNQIDDYNTVVIDLSKLSATPVITLVDVSVQYSGAAASANASFVVRAKAQASGTVSESAAITPTNTTMQWNSATTGAQWPALTLYVSPQTGVAFTTTEINALQVGVRLSATSTNAARVSSLQAMVEYIPREAKLIAAGLIRN